VGGAVTSAAFLLSLGFFILTILIEKQVVQLEGSNQQLVGQVAQIVEYNQQLISQVAHLESLVTRSCVPSLA
jgi:hypothetical protein